MGWPDAHQEAMYFAAEAHEKYGVDTLHRIDVFAAIASAGLDLFFRPCGGTAGAYMPAESFGAAGIVINSDHPLALQRYSGGHELGHHEFGHGAKIDYETELATRPEREIDADEMRAEAFASWFLMPPELVELVLEKLGLERPQSPRDVYQLALRMGTSYQAACYHLPSVKLLARAKAHDWGQLELRKVKEQITSARRAEGWRYDVWAIREGDDGQTLVVRAGDRLVFELADIELIESPAQAVVLETTAETLFSQTPTLEIDIPQDAPRGRAAIELDRGGARFWLELEIERPRLGVYRMRTNVQPSSRATS